MKKKVKEREVRLQAWLLNHSAEDTAIQCGCSRQIVSRANADDDREVYLLVKGGVILRAYEKVGKKDIWFKG